MMRTLNQTEVNDVSGGTFGLLSCLLGGLFAKKSYDCTPAPKCQPAPKCDPKPKSHC